MTLTVTITILIIIMIRKIITIIATTTVIMIIMMMMRFRSNNGNTSGRSVAGSGWSKNYLFNVQNWTKTLCHVETIQCLNFVGSVNVFV